MIHCDRTECIHNSFACQCLLDEVHMIKKDIKVIENYTIPYLRCSEYKLREE